MPFIPPAQAPTFHMHGATFTGLASPSRGSCETAVWVVELCAGAAGASHRLTREEVFVALAGSAVAKVGDEVFHVTTGGALVVPPGVDFALSNPHGEPFRAVAVLPVGGQAVVPQGQPFTPPWAA